MKNYKMTEMPNGAIRVELDPLSDERKELLKLYKENSLIKGYTEKSEYNLTALDYKLFDLIYKLTGDKVRFWGKDEKQRAKTIPNQHLKLEISQNVVAELLELKKDKNNTWKRDIEKSLTRLSKQSFILRDYVDKDLGHLEFYRVTLIALPKMKKIDESGKNDIIEIIVPDIIVLSAWRAWKYTPLILNEINKVNSKYALRLFEYIKMIESYQIKNLGIKKLDFLDICFDELRFIFDKPKVKNISTLFQSIRFEKVVMPELNKILMCDYEYFKKDKKITLNFKVPFIPKEFKEPSLFNDDGQPNEKFLKETKEQKYITELKELCAKHKKYQVGDDIHELIKVVKNDNGDYELYYKRNNETLVAPLTYEKAQKYLKAPKED